MSMENKREIGILTKRTAPADLLCNIMASIDLAESRKLKQRFFASIVGLLASILLFGLSSFRLYQDLSHSGFLSSFNLIFSDSSLVLSYWKDFSAMLIEAMPMISAATFLGAVAAVMFSLGFLLRFYPGRARTKIFKTNFA